MRHVRSSARPAAASADLGLAVGGPCGMGGVRRFTHDAMATVFEVLAAHPDARYAAQAARAAFDLADRLEAQLSRFLPNSDVGRINRLASGERTRVSPATMECLEIARYMFDLTGGAFDVAVGTGLPSLEFEPDDAIVRAARDGVRIDLGGIGKGYAVDLMAELLEEWELEQALVHGGFSSVLALDAAAGCDGWPLTLSEPGAPSRRLARLSARQTALGASGLQKGAHVVDPRTGERAGARLAAWVALRRPDTGAGTWNEGGPRAAAVADALATAFMLLRPDEIATLCAGSPGLEAWILDSPAEGAGREARLRHLGGSGPGYTAASS